MKSTFEIEEVEEGLKITVNLPIADEIVEKLSNEELEDYIRQTFNRELLKGIQRTTLKGTDEKQR